MSLSTYSDLKTAITDWLGFDELVPRVPDFVSLAEANFDRVIRAKEQVTRATTSATTQYVSLPTDYLELDNVQINTSPVKRLEQVSLSKADDLKRTNNATGEPIYFSIQGNTLELIPTPSSSTTLEIVYYAKLEKLTASNTTNWLLSGHPDIYLYGTLLQAEPFLGNDERVTTWGTLLSKGLEELRVSDEKAQTDAGTLVMRAKNNLDYGDWK